MRNIARARQGGGSAQARAPGKVIIAGEHFAVLGAPAVVMAINLYARAQVKRASPGIIEVEANIPLHLLGKHANPGQVDRQQLLEPLRLAAEETLAYTGNPNAGLTVTVECDIPIGAGLGSSASTTVAIIAAVAKAQSARLSRKEICRIAFVPERYLHGKPSGVDQAACTCGGVIKFRSPLSVYPLKLKRVPTFLVCDTGIHRSTRNLVGAVVKKSKTEKGLFESHLDRVKQISNGTVRALRSGDDEELGFLMNQNHELLMRIGVSHPRLNELVREARTRGALGAKLTGAGGGGCILALCRDKRSRVSIGRALRRQGGIPYMVSMDAAGVVASSQGRALK